MGQLRDRMMHDLERAGYVPETRHIYLNSIRDFAQHHRRSPEVPVGRRARPIDVLTTARKIGRSDPPAHCIRFLYAVEAENVVLACPPDQSGCPRCYPSGDERPPRSRTLSTACSSRWYMRRGCVYGERVGSNGIFRQRAA